MGPPHPCSRASNVQNSTPDMRNSLKDAKRRAAEAELNYTMLQKTSAIKEQGYLQQIENLKQLLAATEAERDSLRQLLRNQDDDDTDEEETPKVAKKALYAEELTPTPSPRLASKQCAPATLSEESPPKRTITPPSSDRDVKRLQEKKPEAVVCTAEIIKSVLDNHDRAEGKVAPKIDPGKPLVFGSTDPRLAKFVTAHPNPVAEWKSPERPRAISPNSLDSDYASEKETVSNPLIEEFENSIKIEEIEGNSDVSTIIGGLERPTPGPEDDNASTVAETASNSDPGAGFDSDDSIDQELNTLFPEATEILRQQAEQEEAERVCREYPTVLNSQKPAEQVTPVANYGYQPKPFTSTKDPWVAAKTEALMNAMKINLRNFSTPGGPSNAHTSRPAKVETPSPSIEDENKIPADLTEKKPAFIPKPVKASKPEKDARVLVIDVPADTHAEKAPSRKFSLPPKPPAPAARESASGLKPTAPVFQPRAAEPTGLGMSFDTPPLIPQKAPVSVRNVTGLEATKRIIKAGITQPKRSAEKPKLAETSTPMIQPELVSNKPQEFKAEKTTDDVFDDDELFIPGRNTPEPTPQLTPKKKLEYNPWANSMLPHNFAQIREVSVRNIPQETSIETILRHVNFGILEKVSMDWNEREVRLLFVEPEAARAAYSYFHQHGLWLESKKGGLDVGPDGQIHCHLNAFLWNSNSLPLSFELRKGVFVKNMTRITFLSKLPRDKRSAHALGKDIMEGFTDIKTRDVFEKITVIGKEAEVGFTSLEYVVQGVRTLIKNKGYQGIKMEYGPDPCGDLMDRPARWLNPLFRKFRVEPGDYISSDSEESEYDDDDASVTENLINLSRNPKVARPVTPQKQAPVPTSYRDVLASRKTETQQSSGNIKFVFGKQEDGKHPPITTTKIPGSTQGTTPGTPASGSHWAQNERFAFRAYQETVKREEDDSPAVSPTAQQDEVNAKAAERKKKRDQETAISRTVHITGLPNDITLKEFMLFVRGGAVDTVTVYAERGEALVVFVYPASAVIYRKHLINNRICIGTNQLCTDNNLPRLSEMRLWTPEKVERHGASRCLFVGGLPHGTTEQSLTADLKNPAKSDFTIEAMQVHDVRAWIWFPSISVAHWAMKEIKKSDKYAGARVEYMRDRCEAPIPEVVSRDRLANRE